MPTKSETSGSAQLTLGTRGSKLALWQAEHVAAGLRAANPGLVVELEIIKTKGDKITDVALSKLGDKGLFTKELEVALLEGRIDLCVHSMKDLPTALPDGLKLVATLPRADVRDVLVANEGVTLENLPAGAKVGTSALRRLAQLRSVRPDLDFVDLRGNLDTRIGKVKDGQLDAAILASAGITRMGWEENIAQYLAVETVLPAVGQGAIGIEIRANDARTERLCSPLSDTETLLCVGAERHIMCSLDGGCQTPFAAYARITREDSRQTFSIDALVASVDASQVVRASIQEELTEDLTEETAQALAQFVVEDLLVQGARAIMEEARRNA